MEPDRLLDWPQLAKIVPYTRQHIGRLEKVGQFPCRVRIGANRIGWRASEVTAWVEARQPVAQAPAKWTPRDIRPDA